MRKLSLLLMVALGWSVLGCSGSDGDTDAAAKASAAAPKSVDQLPSDMPPEARAAAAAAINQAQQRQQQASDPARVKAFQEMQKQNPGK